VKLAVLLYAAATACFTTAAWLEHGASIALCIAGLCLIVGAFARAAAWSEGVCE